MRPEALFVILEDDRGEQSAPVVVAQEGRVVSVVGLDGRPSAGGLPRTAQGLAAMLADEVRASQPRGPYQLAGCGPSAMLAYEVAVQLIGMDEEVGYLGLLDVPRTDWAARRAELGLLAHARDDRAESLRAAALRRAMLEYEPASAPVLVHQLCSTTDGSLADERARTRAVWHEQVVARHVISHLDHGDRPALLRALGAALIRFAAKGVRRPAVPASSHLIRIQGASPSATPTFCIPGAGASVADFVHLTAAVGETATVYGLQPRGMDGAQVPHSRVTAAASAYLRELRAASPRGEVRLVGHSFGGWVALEMALRLEAEGRHVASLTLLDSECPGGDGRLGREYTRAEALMSLIALYEMYAGVSFGLTLSELDARSPDEQLGLMRDCLVRARLISERSTPRTLAGPLRTFEAALRARYVPERQYSGNLALVLVPASGERPVLAHSRFLRLVEGWKKLAPNLVFRRGSGNHVTLLKPPNVNAIGAFIRSNHSDSHAENDVPRATLGA